MRKHKALFILCLSFIYSLTQAQVTFEVNTRSAKVDTCFDYFVGAGVTDSILNKFEVAAFGSFERDRGTYYHSYKCSISNQYFKVSHITDTEKDINISSCNVYYSMNIKDVTTRLGFDLSYTDTILYGAYLSLKYKSLKIDAAFNSKLYNFAYSYNPRLKVSERIALGIIIKGFYIEEKFKWQNGITATINI